MFQVKTAAAKQYVNWFSGFDVNVLHLLPVERASYRVIESAMSEETERAGEKSSPAVTDNGGGSNGVARVLLSAPQLETAAADALRAAWRSQDSYIDHLESLNKQLEGIYDRVGL